jgi:hypothetical protein
MEKIAGGWSLSGIWNVHSGFPFNPFYNTNDLCYQGSSYGQLRPAGIIPGAGTSTANSTFEQSINPNYGADGTKFFTAPSYVPGAAFPLTAPAPLAGIRRNSLNGPGYNDVDGSLAKAFGLPRIPGLGENARFEIRADIYNLFNKTNINPQSINGNLGSVAPDGPFPRTRTSEWPAAHWAAALSNCRRGSASKCAEPENDPGAIPEVILRVALHHP